MSMPLENSNKVVDIARKAIPFMSDHNIPIIPQNYCIWYEYFYGRMVDLKITLDKLINTQAKFDNKLNQEIYTRFFTRNHTDEQERKLDEEIKVIEEVHATAGKILEPIAKGLDGASQNTRNYGGKLKEMVEKIKDDKEIGNIHSIMMTLAKETEKISDENSAISTGLKDSTKQLEDLRLKLAQAKAEARIDDLTKVKNRRAFNEAMTEIIEAVNQKETSATFSIVDIDKFKRINDTYGHPVGDKALASIAAQLTEHTDNKGEVFRIGGEEFGVILPDSSLHTALKLMDSIRSLVAEHQFTIRDAVETITISVGIAEIKKGVIQTEVENLADTALYMAKESGRNKVMTEKDLRAQDVTGA